MKKRIAVLLCLVMVFSMLPATAFATDSATYTAITSAKVHYTCFSIYIYCSNH